MSKCVRLWWTAHTWRASERALVSISLLHSNSDMKSVSRVSFGVYATIFPFQPAVSVIHTLLLAMLNVSLFYFVVLQNYTGGNLSRCCTLRAPRLSLSLSIALCVSVFFNFYVFFRMDLFCFGRLLSVTITWNTDSTIQFVLNDLSDMTRSSLTFVTIFWFICRVWEIKIEKNVHSLFYENKRIFSSWEYKLVLLLCRTVTLNIFMWMRVFMQSLKEIRICH